jgi:hypothetical protein
VRQDEQPTAFGGILQEHAANPPTFIVNRQSA